MTKPTLTGIGDGILMPMMANRFQLSLSRLGQRVFGNQVRCADVDLLNKKIYVEVEQPLSDCGLFDEIVDICSPMVSPILYIKHMACDGKATCCMEFRHCKVIDHKYRLDYAVNEVATHKLVFEFKQVQLVGYDQLSRQ